VLEIVGGSVLFADCCAESFTCGVGLKVPTVFGALVIGPLVAARTTELGCELELLLQVGGCVPPTADKVAP